MRDLFDLEIQGRRGTLSFRPKSMTMTETTRTVLGDLLYLMAWLFFLFAGFSFWAGGKVISEFAKMDRIVAEGLGIWIAVVAVAIGVFLKTKAGDLRGDEESSDQ